MNFPPPDERYIRYYFETQACFDDYMRAREALCAFNALPCADYAGREARLRGILGGCGKNVRVEPPFTCDFGKNIFFGDNVFFNYNATILDGARITIGDNTIVAPNAQIYASTHPIAAAQRAGGEVLGCEAKPVSIGKNCWLGGGVMVLPGVTIGDNAVIGTGSVVVKDIPSNVVAAGNPCRVIRAIKD